MKNHHRRGPAALASALLAMLVAACGGGSDTAGDGSASDEIARSASAAGVVVVDDSLRAQAAVLAAARGVIAISGVAGNVPCAGGGTALFTATAGSTGSLFNGLPDAGEVYRISFNGCRSGSGSAVVDGTLTLTVNSASTAAGSESLSVGTSSQLEVVLPQRTLIFSGTSTFSHTVQTSGSTQVVTDRWVSPSTGMASRRNGRITTLSLTDVDLTHSVTTTGGVVTGSSNLGTVTIGYAGASGRWSATITTDGLVSFNAGGVPIAGRWLITLPRDLIVLTVVNGDIRAAFDFGRNGSIEQTLLWPILLLAQVAD